MLIYGHLPDSVQFSRSVVSDSLRPHGLQHARPPCPSPTCRAFSNSCPLSQWCHPTISSSVIPFSSCLQSFPAWGSFPMSQFFTSGGLIIGVSASASVLPMNIQDWFPLGLTGYLLAVQGTFNSLQHHSSKASILWCSDYWTAQTTQLVYDQAIQDGSSLALCTSPAPPYSHDWPSLLIIQSNQYTPTYLPRAPPSDCSNL